MQKDVIIIPADPRHPINKQALITNEMKAECIGEFSWTEDAPYYDEDGEIIDYVATRVVPWTVCKEIYKRMARVASHHRVMEVNSDE